MKSWLFLAAAIIFEVSATSSLKHAATSENKLFIVLFAVLMATSFALMFQAIKHIDLSIAYAIWSGVGLVLVALVGFLVFKEQISTLKIIFLSLIIIGVVGLKYLSKA